MYQAVDSQKAAKCEGQHGQMQLGLLSVTHIHSIVFLVSSLIAISCYHGIHSRIKRLIDIEILCESNVL